MRPVTVLYLLLPLLSACLLPAAGWGGEGHAACRQEEKRLQAEEAERCSGLNYIFNPSACFNARKALAPYAKGKCREAAAGEGTSAQPVQPAGSTAITPPAQAARVTYVAEELPGKPHFSKVTPAEAATPAREIEQLRSEVSELREELWRLKEELARQRCLQR